MKHSEIFKNVYDFHGHICLMSTAGVRIAIAAMSAIDLKKSDEWLFAYYHAKTCAVDPIQFITGCTLGNGNIIVTDERKHILKLVRQEDEHGVIVTLRPDVLKMMRDCTALKRALNSEEDKTKKQKAKLQYDKSFEQVLHYLQNKDEAEIVSVSNV